MNEIFFGVPVYAIVFGLLALVVILLIMEIVQFSQISAIKKRFRVFMEGKDAKNLEDTLIMRLEQVDQLLYKNIKNEESIQEIKEQLAKSSQKIGILKYDALDEQGGKLSYVLVVLDEHDTGYLINSVHAREGSYSYIKEIIEGNAIIGLSPEEREALTKALNGEM